MELYPNCPKCQGKMLPLSDYGDTAAVIFKAWCCVKCGYALRVDKGVITFQQVFVGKP